VSVPEPILTELSNGAAWLLREVIREVRVRRAQAQTQTEIPAVPATPPWHQTPPWEGQAPPWASMPDALHSTPATAAPAVPSPAPAAGAASSYAVEMDDAPTACINCTRRHLWEMRLAAQKAAEAAQAGDTEEARRRTLRVVGEGLALRRFDWTPEKIDRVKGRDTKAILAAAPHVMEVLSTAPQPPQQLALAWASLDEAMRFARSPRPTDRDRAEINLRLDEAGAQISDCESEVLPSLDDQDRQWLEQVLPGLRTIRHSVVEHLNGRKEMSRDELDAAERYLHQVAVELTPAPDPDTARRLAEKAAAAEREFKQALFFGEDG
jgi:hypothetical protein